MSTGGRVGRAEKLLNRIGANLGLSVAGKNWLIRALDPFHDSNITCEGFPDGQSYQCITQQIKQTVAITAPPYCVSNNLNFDCLIIDLPFLGAGFIKLVGPAGQAFTLGPPEVYFNSFVVNSSASGYTSFVASWMMILCVPAGHTFDWVSFSNDYNAGKATVTYVQLDSRYTAGDYRVISKGFEVHNTSSELNRQGSVICGELPVPDRFTAFTSFIQVQNSWTSGSPTTNATADVLPIPMWPASQADALRLPGSVQWEAKDGCYCPATLTNLLLPISNCQVICPYFYDTTGYAGAIVIPAIPVNINTGQSAFPVVNLVDFNMKFAYFAGMAVNTTLQLNSNITVERFPDSTLPDLEVLAHPSPHRDTIAMDMYSSIVSDIAVAVPVSENSFGDFFSDAIGAIKDYVQPVLSVIPHPAAQALSKGIDMANGLRGQSPKEMLKTVAAKATQAAVKKIEKDKVAKQSKESGRASSGHP
jgi:hypothetical protein